MILKLTNSNPSELLHLHCLAQVGKPGFSGLIRKLAMVLFAASHFLLRPPGAVAQDVNVVCYSNSDGTTSCERLNDGKWFVCVPSVGRTSTCQSDDGDAITCVRLGDGVSRCSSAADSRGRVRTGFGRDSDFSVFGE